MVLLCLLYLIVLYVIFFNLFPPPYIYAPPPNIKYIGWGGKGKNKRGVAREIMIIVDPREPQYEATGALL